MNIKDSYIHGADGKGVVKFLYFASAAENNILGVDGGSYNAKAKDLIFLLADIGGTKIGLSIPTWNLNTTGSAGSVLTVKRSTDADHFLTFVDTNNNLATAESIYTAADIKYNPSTKILTVPNLSTNSGITIGGTFVTIGGTYSPVTSITASSTDDDIPSAAAVWAMLSSGLQANDAMVFKGVLNGGTNTTYTPAAECGHVYKVAVAGKINGDYYEVGDTLICAVDNTAAATSSNVSTVKTNWYAIQTNISDYLLKTGGTMTGNLKWKDTTALPTINSMANANILVVDGMDTNTDGTTKQISLSSLLANMKLSPSIGDGTSTNTVKITVNGTDSSDYTIPYATSAANLTGGALGSIPYLTAEGTTQFLAGGSNNQVLRYDGTNKKPYWGADIDTTGVKLATVSGTAKTDSTVITTSSSTGLSLLGVTNYIKIGDGTNYIQVPVTVDHTVATTDAGAEKLLSAFPKGLSFLGTYNRASYTTPFPTSYGGVITMNGTGGGLIYVCWQGGYTDSYTDDLLNTITTEMYLRNRRDNQTKWTGWTRVLTNKNYSSFASPLSHTHSVTINGSSKTIPASDEDPVDLGSYLPLTGGTLSLSTVDSLVIKKTTNTTALIKFTGWKSTDTLVSGYNTDTDYGYIGFMGANNPVFRHTNDTSYTLAHAGNITQSADPVVLAWNTSKTIATIAGVDINVKLPTNPNTWRNIYVGGTSKVGTGTDTKAINYSAGTAISLGFTAAGTGTGLNADYFSVIISGVANDKDNPGYVAAPKSGSNYLANKVWKTDANGNPAWRDDANTWVANAVGVAGYVAAPTAASNKNHVWMTNASGEPAWRGVTIADTVPTIGTSDTTLVTIGGISVKAKIGSYSASNHNHDGRYLREFGTIGSGNALFDIDTDPGYSGEITYDPVATNVYNTIKENNPNVTALNLGNSFSRRKLLIFTYSNDNIYYRRHLGAYGNTPALWTTAVKILHTGNIAPELIINSEDNTYIAIKTGGIISDYITIPYATLSASLVSDEIYNGSKTLTVSNWTVVKDISSYAAGTYAISISSSNLYASGIFSVCNGTDVMTDEIVLHVSNTTDGATWRPYARVSGKNLELSCNETTGTARTYIVKILKLI